MTKKELASRLEEAKSNSNAFEALQLQLDAIREYLTAPAARTPTKRRKR